MTNVPSSSARRPSVSTTQGRRVVRIEFPDDLILDSVDAEGRDILSLGLKIRERGGKTIRQALFSFPVMMDWNDFNVAVGTTLQLMSTSVGDLKFPDDWQAEKNKKSVKVYLNMMAAAIRIKSVRDSLFTAITEYMDPIIDGDEPLYRQDAVDWLKRNLTIADFTQLAIAVTAIPQELEKKTTFGLMALFPNLITSSSKSVSVPSSESQRKSSGASPTSEPVQFSFGQGNTTSESPT